MGTIVAEYYGNRTDTESLIYPMHVEKDKAKRKELVREGEIPPCPFTNKSPCTKILKGNEPVCSVRKSDGTLWITCPDRLCSTGKTENFLCKHQKDILLQVGRYIFSPKVSYEDICVKREERLSVVEGTTYNADFIISLRTGSSSFSGPDRLVLEMQGGGETTNTGDMTGKIQL